jgi:CHAT domain-containing protein
MTYSRKFQLTLFLFVLCICTAIAQIENHQSTSDSLLFENKIEGALQALVNDHLPSDAQALGFRLRQKYLSSLSEYQKSYDEDLFPTTRDVLDSIMVEETLSLKTREIYLLNFMSAFSRRILSNTTRIEYCDQGLSLAQNTVPQDTLFLIHFLYVKASAKSDDEMFAEALEDLELAETLCLNFQPIDSNLLAKIFYRSAVCFKAMQEGLFDKGYEYLQKAEQTLLALENPDSSVLAQTYGMLSDIAWNYRDYENGLNYVKKYRAISSQIGRAPNEDPIQEAETKYHFFYKEMQFYQEHQKEEALALLKKAESDFEQYKENEEIKLRMAAIYNLMGETYIRSEPSASVPYYEKAIKTLNNKNSAYHHQYLFNLGKGSLYSGDALKSLEYSTELIELAAPINGPNLPHFYFLKAYAYIKLGNFEKALEITKEVLKVMDPSDRVDLNSHINLRNFKPTTPIVISINLLSRMGMEFKNSFPNNPLAQRTANALFQLGIIEYGRSIKAAKVTGYTKSMYEQLLSGIISTREYLKEGDLTIAELIEFSENTNEKYLWTNHISNSDPNLYFDPAVLEEEAKLRAELIELKQEAISDSSEDLTQLIFDINLQLEKIDKKKRKSNSSYYNFEEAEFSFETFRAKISPEVLVLKYEFILDSLYLFEITGSETKVNTLDTDNAFLAKIDRAYAMIADPLSDQDSLKQILKHVADILLPQIDDNIASLVIKVNGKLNLLPFDLLIRNGKYLIEDFTISYINALGLYESGQQMASVSNALIMAPTYNGAINLDGLLAVRGDEFDLSGALEEANLLGNLLPGKVLLGENAVKSSFVKTAEDHDLLHFSMHSLLNDADPELSNLAFYDGEENNKLYISELYGMRLNAHLAVLSACNTGIGEEETGDGIVSLNRAFTFAGVPSVVSSLWSAPDNATKDVMLSFYQNLGIGMSKPEALRNAKLDYINAQKMERFRHPYFWAGFVVHGDPSPIEIVRSKIKPAYYLLLAGILILGLGIGFIRKNRAIVPS